VARACEDRAPELFAAFMTAASTAAEGRNALYEAPSFPLADSSPVPAVDLDPATDPAQVADRLAALAALAARRLGAVDAALPRDRAACRLGAQAAMGTWRLLAAAPATGTATDSSTPATPAPGASAPRSVPPPAAAGLPRPPPALPGHSPAGRAPHPMPARPLRQPPAATGWLRRPRGRARQLSQAPHYGSDFSNARLAAHASGRG
jgi:hypothetical protein